MTKVITSKQFSLSWRDVLRGLLVGIIISIIPAIEEAKDAWVNGGAFIIPWREIVDLSWKATVSYLTLNFFTPSKVMAVPGKNETVKATQAKVEKVV